jgi:hypothetical protein
VAWFVTSVYYFYQYMIRSAPAVMVPEMSAGLGLTAAGVASLVGLFYYAYAPFSLVAAWHWTRSARAAWCPSDAPRWRSARCCSRPASRRSPASVAFVQGAGGVFALIGAVYLATTYLPAARARR